MDLCEADRRWVFDVHRDQALMFDSGEDEERYTLDKEGSPHLVDSKTGDDLDLERENIELEQRLPIGASLVRDGNVDPNTASHDGGSVLLDR